MMSPFLSLARLLALLFLTLVGCASQSPFRIDTLPPSREQRGRGSQLLTELAASVEAFDGKEGGSLRDLALIVKDLGNALRPIARPAARKVHALGARIDGGSAVSAVSLVKDALHIMSQTLGVKSGPSDRKADYERAILALAQTTDALKDLVPLAEQAGATAAALRAATDVVFLSSGGEPPFGEADGIDFAPYPATPPTSLAQALEQARDALAGLAKSRWMRSRAASSRALFSLADVIAAADGKKELAGEISEVRFQAERLKRTDASSFGQAGWVRAGLTSALDALDTLEGGPGGPNCTPIWLQTARSATANIDGRSSLSFQRAAIQDAFRTTVDAFTAATQPTSSCVETK